MTPLEAIPAPTAPRRRFEGVWHILRFNWTFYIIALAACITGVAVLLWLELPNWLRLPGWIGIGTAAFWTLASLAVSFYVYDLSPLYRWQWLAALFPSPPQCWANIHCGLDESSLALHQLFAPAQGHVLDIYDAQLMTEPSIARARAFITPPVAPIIANHSALPLQEASINAVFVLFTAHELREPAARLRFFQELKRIAAPGAQVVVVEHLRDAANFIAFGPGFMHFLPRQEWQRLAIGGGFHLIRSFNLTPFVTVFVLQHKSDDVQPPGKRP